MAGRREMAIYEILREEESYGGSIAAYGASSEGLIWAFRGGLVQGL